MNFSENLMHLTRLFEVSLDELVGKKPAEKNFPVRYIGILFHYEYASKRTVRGIPLVHISLGIGLLALARSRLDCLQRPVASRRAQ